MQFLKRVERLIKANNITKNKMLTDIGLPRNAFINWSKRGTIPSGETLQKIADYFNVSVDYLLGNTDKKNKPTVDEDDELIKKFIDVTNTMSEADLSKVMDYIDYISSKKK